MRQLVGIGFLVSAPAITGVPQASGQQTCRPSIIFTAVHFSDMRPPTLKRTWSATVLVDTSSCAANAQGQFEIVFRRLKENAPDSEYRQRFPWVAPSVQISVDFWADEAAESYRADNVTPCPCAR